MKFKKEIALFVLAVIIAFAAGMVNAGKLKFQDIKTRSLSTRSKSIISIGEKLTILAEVADTPEKHSLGLGGRESLSDNEGMLFPFSDSTLTPHFWMKGMLIPIDIIWIKDSQVFQIDKNLQPEPDKSDLFLTVYSPRIPVDYALEVRGKLSEEHDITVGDKVEISL